MNKADQKASRHRGAHANGDLIQCEMAERGMRHSAVIREFNRLIRSKSFRAKHPDLFAHGDIPDLDPSKFAALIRGEADDPNHTKLSVLAVIFGYDSYEALSLDTSYNNPLTGDSKIAMNLLLDYIHDHRRSPHEKQRERCLFMLAKKCMIQGKLSTFGSEFASLDLTPTGVRTVFDAAVKCGELVRRNRRYLIAPTPISTLIKHARQRCQVLQWCVRGAYDEEFGTRNHRRSLASLLEEPLDLLKKATDREIAERDATCQVALTARNFSMYQHFRLERPFYCTALSYLLHRRRTFPDLRYSEGYRYESYGEWFRTFSGVNYRKWSEIHDLLKDGNAEPDDICGVIQAMTDSTCINLMAVEYSIVGSIGRAKENKRFAKLTPMEEL